MKLSTIEIANFRCFESLSLALQPDVNVFVGANGAGKSTVLDAIAVALYPVVLANGGGGAKRERGRQAAALKSTDIRIEQSAGEELKGRKDFVQFRASAVDYYPIDGFSAKTDGGSDRHLEWSEYIQYVPPAGFHYEGPGSPRLAELHRYVQGLWQEIRRSEPAAQIPLPVIAYYRSHRRIGEMPALGDVFAVSVSREKAFANALDAGTSFQAMCQWFYLKENEELRMRASEPGTQAEFRDLAAVRTALSNVIERLDRIFFQGSPPRLKVQIRGAGAEYELLELAQLSDGYRSLLALILDFARRLAQAHPNWANPLKAPGILLIDEVELHLHPRWQQTVIPDLRAAFPNTQLLVSTHSPSVVQTARRDQLWILDSEHSVARAPNSMDPYGAEHSAVLTEVFGGSLKPLTEECKARLRQYTQLIGLGQFEGPQALGLRGLLNEAVGDTHPELRRCDAEINLIKSKSDGNRG